MNKTVKKIGIAVLAVVGVLIVAVVLLVTVFRGEASNYLKEDYVKLLKAVEYNNVDTLDINFHYAMNDSILLKVREYFQLDTLFDGTEDTWQKGLKIQSFVSSNQPHDNPKEMTKSLNAIDLWKYVDSTGNYMNCRQHSIMMRDMLLSVGIKTRVVSCMPYDSTDMDCHVVNEIYSPELDQWIMLDSDQNHIVTDIDGNPMSIRMLHDFLTNDKPYLIDGKPNKGLYYDRYMAKNAYWYNREVISDMDSETGDNRKSRVYVSLVPEGFELGKSSVYHYRFAESVHTSNPDLFWK
ncbi:MAG: transglutaminase-like domain-containing protein [Fermentimonas sp.]|jgi:hypothetical protein